MATPKIDVDIVRNILSQSRKVEYNNNYSIIIYIPTKEEYTHFELLCNNDNKSLFEEVCKFPKEEIMLFGDTHIDGDKYDKDEVYRKDMNYYLNLVIPSIKEDNKVKYACYSTIRKDNIIHFLEPTVLSSFNCLLSLLNRPDYIIVRRVKNNSL